MIYFPTVNFLQGSDFMHIRAVGRETPNTVNPSVARTRRYLTGREVEKLIEAARKHGRYGHRDATMILLAYRHGLRASELCDLQWHQVEINTGRLHVRRSKKGTPSVHPMQGDEIRALRRLQREQEVSPYVFTSERGGPMSAKSFGTLFERLGRRAGMPFTIFPHMLRHACARHAGAAGMARAQEYPAHGSLYRTFACPLPRLLEGEWPLNESVLPLRDSRTSETASGGVR
jgi:integrase